MILQTLDIKDNCTGIFNKTSFLFDNFDKIIKKHSKAWKHSPILDDEKYNYIYLYLKGEDLSRYSYDSEMYEEFELKMESHAKAARTAKIELDDMCFFDIIPENQLIRWFTIRRQCMDNILDTVEKPSDYDILHKAHVLATEVSHKKRRYGKEISRVKYNIFGSATGRFTTVKGSIPILNLKKENRSQLTPNNDLFLELDFNAAELRTLLSLSGRNQPVIDIHEWNIDNVFRGDLERSKAKQRVFAWLYNPEAVDTSLEQCYNREIFRDFFSTEDQILTTPFGRKLYVEERKAQSYLLQSTTSDIVIENAYKIMKMLKGKKSNIAFTLHDSVVLDFAKEDHKMVQEIRSVFEETRLGRFLSNVSIGKNFGNMKEMRL
tara:strand:- start:414 stop:1544 length:1131 start_codon:yes stop_codon:yes gene_type:complete